MRKAVADLVGGGPVPAGHQMAVDVQRGRHLRVAEPPRDGDDVLARFQQQGGLSVPRVVETGQVEPALAEKPPSVLHENGAKINSRPQIETETLGNDRRLAPDREQAFVVRNRYLAIELMRGPVLICGIVHVLGASPLVINAHRLAAIRPARFAMQRVANRESGIELPHIAQACER